MSVMPPEAELLLLSIGVADRRAECRERIEHLAGVADLGVFGYQLERQKLLPLVGSRLVTAAGDGLPEWFGEAVESAIQRSRIRAAMLEHVTADLVAALRNGGVDTAMLKGPPLAERLYGDPGLRPSNDVDLLVTPDQFDAAVEILTRAGYARPSGANWVDGLPLFETSLVARDSWLPPIDLHWRVHWYDHDFSPELIERSQRGPDVLPTPEPVDELAMLLLMFARDGFAGARAAADLAAWWDSNAPGEDEPLLADVMSRHTPLRRALEAAAAVGERLVGVPAGRLVPSRPTDRQLAPRLHDWRLESGLQERFAATTLVDWLLRPPGGARDFLHRHIFIPQAAVMEAYDASPNHALARRALWLRYGLVMLARVVPRWGQTLWRTRGGRELVAIPEQPLAGRP